MTDVPSAPLRRALDDALALLAAHDVQDVTTGDPSPLPSLLEQCEAICAGLDRQGTPAVRSLHHFACTGGTLIAKCIAALPGSVLLSEIDPLSTLHLESGRKLFYPTDILADLHTGVRCPPQQDLCEIFMAGILHMRDALARRGQTLIVRDHAHSQFCTGVDPATRPTLYEILIRQTPVRALLTLRHPLDSFLSLGTNKWEHFTPFTLEEYSLRYTAFLDAYTGMERMRYEDFVVDPEAVLAQICDILDLPFDPLALDLIDLHRLSGDSGRSSGHIAPRARRDVSEDLAGQARRSAAYAALCADMCYDPDPAADPAAAQEAL
jgi:hypothetical protein